MDSIAQRVLKGMAISVAFDRFIFIFHRATWISYGGFVRMEVPPPISMEFQEWTSVVKEAGRLSVSDFVPM